MQTVKEVVSFVRSEDPAKLVYPIPSEIVH